MKKLLMVLLGVVFAVNLVLLLNLIGECGSPKRVFYTVTDRMMNDAYRLRNGWKIRTLVL